ncbi:bifunctional riboflavin kinase/FAD synthetase [Aestuariimicrobium sp. Y1814]|uniref:bifunctional riboflavin kinase/FAD synthetase n=1 Tax=Aestuariimicrobium sp. Y1814 TaxID=3418742 RepID=UPI003DA6F479
MQSPHKTVVAIGNFDGVHLGHQTLLAEAQAQAPELPLVVVTFWPHPKSVIRPGTEPPLLTDLPDRIDLLTKAGVSEVRVVPFTADVMAWSPQEFVDRVLLPLQPAVIVVGSNFTFGRKAAGTVATLKELGTGRYQVHEVDLTEVAQVTTCSSAVRQALADGDVEGAAEHLGRPFRYSGVVMMGHQRGRDLGFPTANLPVERGHAAPGDGVYAGWLTIDGETTAMPASISVGTNPTFDDVPHVVVEAYVLDRTDLNLYGKTVHVDFVARLRGNVKFYGLDSLVEQIGKDVEDTRRILAGATGRAGEQQPA